MINKMSRLFFVMAGLVVGSVIVAGCGGGGGSAEKATYYMDADLDGYGDADNPKELKTSKAVTAFNGQITVTDDDGKVYADDADDCDDTDAEVNPGMTEIGNNDKDDNCDGIEEESETLITGTDADGDGYFAEDNDCDDGNSAINPEASETCGNSIDEDCSGTADDGCSTGATDADGDGVTSDVDCDDNDATVREPTTFYQDSDSDGFGDTDVDTSSCETSYAGYVTNGDDCDDSSSAINPSASEGYFYNNGGDHGDNKDNNCDEEVDETVCSCESLTGYDSPTTTSWLYNYSFIRSAEALTIERQKVTDGLTSVTSKIDTEGKSIDTEVLVGGSAVCNALIDTFKSLPGWDCVEKTAEAAPEEAVVAAAEDDCDDSSDNDGDGFEDCNDSDCSQKAGCWDSTVFWKGAGLNFTEPTCSWFNPLDNFIDKINDVLRTFGLDTISANDLEWNGVNLEYNELRSYFTSIESTLNTSTKKVTTEWIANTNLDYGDVKVAWIDSITSAVTASIEAFLSALGKAIDWFLGFLGIKTDLASYIKDNVFNMNVNDYNTFPSTYRNFYTVGAFNKYYIRVIDNLSKTIDCTNAGMEETGNDGHCKEKIDIDLKDYLNETWLSGKHVAAVLRGFSMDYENPSEQNVEMEDAVVDVSTTETQSGGDIQVTIGVNFNGEVHDKKDYVATVYYSLVVFDPSVVDIETAKVDDSLMILTDGYYDGTKPVSLAFTPASSSQVAATLNMWGFNKDNGGLPVQDIFGYSKLDSLNGSTATIRTKGRLLYEGCDASDTIWKPDSLQATVIACKDKTVCSFSENSSEEGSLSKSDNYSKDSGSKELSVDLK